ncbi:hypothetical protein BBD42_01935 [Paenibacillus sp. BIHB 4019]|uniref:Glycosyl transferase family 1 domain-containing protein n=1 Tax=Paenibacillus sp. BIHB 4019 TaxID=1870819 RepID=A0A1B2DCD6_9BACL|nr:glycosyltransferase [Paenibacillus sp. BIHB 4019]ANY65367.1 hypothetical protein BBD42_01935 [Paenibacillus sp. BIHB 4019]
MKVRRLLWLLNHDTLSKFELPLIKNLGFEIYTPKSTIKEILQSSGSITFEYDHTLTIPEEDLKLLNEYDFFSTTNMPLYIKKIINEHFHTAITYTDTAFVLLRKLIHNFNGEIFFRAFGVGPSKFKNYTDLINFYFTENDHHKLKQISKRFWFSQCYSNLLEIEDDFYKKNAVYMPLGLPNEFYEIENEWIGNQDKILFFCTRIKYIAESEKVYNQFKKDFSGFDYIIAGNQPVPVDDEKVTGFLEREQLNELYKNCKVMYYHSTHPRHLHYHPLEAMIAGMPVVYMEGSLLSNLAKDTQQAGCCNNIKEARMKIKKIIGGDKELINNIINDQKGILHKFSYEYNKLLWEQNFIPIVNAPAPVLKESAKKIALFLTESEWSIYKEDYVQVVKMLNAGLKKLDEKNSITFNILGNKFDTNRDFMELLKDGVSIRDFKLQEVSLKSTIESLALLFQNEQLWHNSYIMPVDYARNYVDADYWLFLNHELDEPIAPIKPYGIYIDNLGERFYNTISDFRISNYKNASFLFTSSLQTKIDLVKHVGIAEEKISIIPFVFSDSHAEESPSIESYYLLEVDSKKINHIKRLLTDLQEYYRLSGRTEKVKIHLNNYKFDGNDDYDARIIFSNMIKESKFLKNKVTMYFDLKSNEYNALYSHAKKIIIIHDLKHVYFKLAKAMQYKKETILHNFPFYKDFENALNYTFNYKNFASNDNVLFEVFSESIEDKQVDAKLEHIHMNAMNEIAQVWRKLL